MNESNDLVNRKRKMILERVFRPSSPVTDKELFLGRINEINSIIKGINRTGTHIVLYGERGVGKTSLSNIIPPILKDQAEDASNFNIIRVTCNRRDGFTSIWEKILGEIRDSVKANENINTVYDSEVESTFAEYLEGEEASVSKIFDIIEHMNMSNIFVIDEFDTVQKNEAKEKFSDLIKLLSDNSTSTTLILVGVGKSVIDLIENHESIERCLRQIELSRMSKEELGGILDKGLELLDLTMDKSIKNSIVDLSEGFPQYTHQLAYHCAFNSIENNTSNISEIEFHESIKEAVEDTKESIRKMYQAATRSTRSEIFFDQVLFACALTQTNDYGEFKIADIKKELSRITKKIVNTRQYRHHIETFCDEKRGGILSCQKTGNEYIYTFTNPLLKVFVKMKYYEQFNSL